MKTTLNLLLASATAVVLISCGKDKTKEMLTKKWQISELKVDGYNDQMAQMKAAADTTKDSLMKVQFESQIKMYEGYMEEMKKATFEYKNDGSFEANIIMMGQTQNQKGSWALSEDAKKVFLTNDKQKTDTMNIDELTNDKLVSTSITMGKKSTVILVPAK